MTRRQSNASNTGGKGAKRMREFGCRAVTLWLTPQEYEPIEEAAVQAGQRVATWVRNVALAEAREQQAARAQRRSRS